MAGGLLGLFDTLTDDRKKPFSSCPVFCTSFPDACTECGQYNRQLEKVLYNVEHMDTFFSDYVIDPNAAPGGERECFNCGAPASPSDIECPYCGEALTNGQSPIRVRSETEVPNPILEAQDIIMDKKEMLSRFQKQKNANNGILGAIMNVGSGIADKMGTTKKMTLAEIQETASAYGVSVHSYLVGLDQGTYLTKAGKAANDALEKMNQQMQAQNAANAAARANMRPTTPSYSAGAATGAAAGGFAAGTATTSSSSMSSYEMQMQMMREKAKRTTYYPISTDTCYSCSYYSALERKCAYWDKDTVAGDYCGQHRSK